MTYDEFKLIYEDLMSNNKFDINNLIYEASKKWTLKDELLSIWPFVQEKFDQGFYDFFGNNKPGEPQYDPNSINSQLINAGTDKPGYIIKINLNDDYAKKLIDPMYEALENKKSYNNPLAPFIDKLRQSKKLNLLLEFYMYIKKPENKDAYDNKYDYQKSLVIEKNTVSGWEGMGFINFDLAAFGGPDRNKSKLKICKIDVSLSTNKSMMSKLSDLNSKYSNHVPDTKESLRLLGSAIGSLGKKISSIGSKKQNKVKAKFKLGSGLSNNRNVDVNISWENYKIENSEDLTLDNYKDGVNKQLQFIPTADHKILQKAIGKNWKTNIIFDKNKLTNDGHLPASFQDSDHWNPISGSIKYGTPISNSDNKIAGTFEMKITDEIYKIYHVLLNISDWKKNNYDPTFLIGKNSIQPIIFVEIKQKPNKVLTKYKMKFSQFKDNDEQAYDYVKNVVKSINKI